jgi:hypothetical protein
MSQAFKDHIWTQLGLSYTIEQIYNKHEAIWWARINVKVTMIRIDFIKQTRHYLLGSQTHKKAVDVYTKIQPFPFTHGHLVI